MNMFSYNCRSLSEKELGRISFLAKLLKLVSEKNRLKILSLLKEKEYCVCQLVECLDMSQSLISHHLSDLREFDLVKREKRGLRVYYSLTNKGRKVIKLLFQI